MLKGLGDLGNIMKLQKEMKNLQKELKKNQTTGSSPDGMVTVTVNGEFEVTSVKIASDLVGGANAVTIERNIADAVNRAVRENKALSAEKMKQLTGGMDLGALGNMF
ncbi:MAG: YbaB/EbfC family nucleoid-associated protein [Spirochaetota bacterium]